MPSIVWLAACSLATVGLACGDSSSSTGSGGSGGGGTSGTTTGTTSSAGGGSPGTCAEPGDLGNENGVGHYCTPGGNECADFPLAGLCLADVGQDEWFCTRIGCDAATNCGADAGCLVDPAGSACVPCACDASGLGCGSGGGGGSGGSGGGA